MAAASSRKWELDACRLVCRITARKLNRRRERQIHTPSRKLLQSRMQADGLVPRVRYIGSKDSGRLATATATASADLGATATATGAEAARRSSERTTASGWMSSCTLSGSGRRTPAGGRRQRRRQLMACGRRRRERSNHAQLGADDDERMDEFPRVKWIGSQHSGRRI